MEVVHKTEPPSAIHIDANNLEVLSMLAFDAVLQLRMFSTLVELLGYRAKYQPNRTAFIFLPDGETETARLSYEELDRLSRAIAAKLQSQAASGNRALLLYPPGIEFISAFFGCLYAGVVAVPAYPPRPHHSISKLQALVNSSQASVALTTTSLWTNIKERIAQNPELAALWWLTTDTVASSLASEWQEPEVNGDTLAFLQYTSGSTGTPKGVMVSHGNLLHNERVIESAFGHTEKTTVVGWLPLYHDMGLIGNVLQPVYLGRPCILMPPMAFLQKPCRWLQAIARYKATTSGGPNFAYDLCAEKITPQQIAGLDLSSWEVAFNGAEPVRARTMEQFAAAFAPYGFRQEAFYPCYGMAETTLIVSGGLKTQPPVVRQVKGADLQQNRVVAGGEAVQETVSVGRTWLDQEIAIANPESLTLCTSEQVGEIWVSGPSVAQGYWNRPEETEQTFRAYLADTSISIARRTGPFIRTGDLGFLQDGELFVTGRLKDLIIIRGRNHYPQDIELTVQNSHPALHSTTGAAFAVEVKGVERLVIVGEVERSYLRRLDVDEVVGAIRRAVSEQHELQVYAVVLLKPASIPKTSSGKIQRHACRVGFLDGSLNVVGDWTANDHQIDSLQLSAVDSLLELPNESAVASRLGEAPSRQQIKSTPTEKIQAYLILHLSMHLRLSPDEIDMSESFAYYGMDSSLALSLTAELGDWLGCELEPTLFWEYPSIEALAQYLADGGVGSRE